jgi:predicted RNase H-like HicB family nuclease
MDMKYTAIYARSKTGYSGHIPDLPGCIAAARTLAQTKQYIQEAVALRLQGTREDGTEFRAPALWPRRLRRRKKTVPSVSTATCITAGPAFRTVEAYVNEFGLPHLG